MRSPARLRLLALAAVGVALGGFCAATPARAGSAPRLAGVAPLTVSTTGARAVIEQNPFRLQIQDGTGATALAEVPNTGTPPQVEPPTQDPIPPGFDNPVTTTLYQPLSFTVGTETLVQQPGLEWAGNLASGTRTGIEYSAQSVLSSKASGGGLQLTLGTDDPTGRHLVVTVTPAATGAIRVNVRADPATGVSEIGDSFASGADESFFGFGGRHNALDQRGQVISNFVNEENLDGGAAGVQAPAGLSMFPNGPTAAYYPQALFYSSRPYGFYDDQPELVRYKLDVDRPDAWNVTASAGDLDYVVAPGSATTAIGTITGLSGREPLPPQWGLGPMLDRLVKNSSETEADYEANLAADVANIDKYHLPLTAYRIEGWGFDGNSDNDGLELHTYVSPAAQAAMIAALHARGIHALAYIRPWFEPGEHDDLAVTRADGSVYEEDVDLGTNIDLPDFTNPATVTFWQGEVAKILDLGFDGFMQDYGESVLFDMHFHDGSTGVTEHNAYLPQYDAATRGELTRHAASHPGRSFFYFTRAGDSGVDGQPGSAASENGNFPGDETTDYTHTSGLASLTSDMLNRAVGGAYGYGTDIGGYLDYTTPATDKQLFLRWAEWAALSPVFRLHGTGIAGTHTPWSYDADTVATYNALSSLHLAAAPLIMKLWGEAETDGVPPTRPLWLQFPGDAEAAKADQEWMLGPDVLVAPVVTEDATSRDVYFPAGCWSRVGASEVHTVAGHATVPATLEQLPYYFRCGTTPFAVAAGNPATAVTKAVRKTAARKPAKRTVVHRRAVAQPSHTLAYTGADPLLAVGGLVLVGASAAVRRRRRRPGSGGRGIRTHDTSHPA